jgi:hypothetical protein
MLFVPVASSAQVGVFITVGPPALPVYEQPPCPEEGYIWAPGYWAYDNDVDDYFWVPGTWVMAPEAGFFWTPPYWGWSVDRFVFYDGYWGPAVGFYGGINYGFGYFGDGYVGGRWDNGRFFYNRAVNNISVTNIRNVYNDTTVVRNVSVTRVSYNGGQGGINARPNARQEAVARERHVAPVAAQTQHFQAARADSQLRASVNRGKPPVAATPRPGSFKERAVMPAKEAGGQYRPGPIRGNEQGGRNPGSAHPENNAGRPGAAIHPRDIPPREASAPPNTGNSKLDRKYQQQQQKLQAQQDKERQRLQQKQEQEHQRTKQGADQARAQQLEQKHQQQTRQLQERHSQQAQKMQERQRPPSENHRPPH